MQPMSSGNTNKLAELFAAIRKEEVWGELTIQLQRGEVALITYRRSFRTIDEARQGLTRPHEEQPGEHDASENIHQDSHRSAAIR